MKEIVALELIKEELHLKNKTLLVIVEDMDYLEEILDCFL
jgi:hypothetical protein